MIRLISPRRLALLTLVLSLAAIFLLLPHDSAILAFGRFTTHSFLEHFRDEQWLLRPASFPLDLVDDVAVVIKTGYGTRHRVSAQLEAFAGDWQSILLVADFGANYTHGGKDLEIHDAVAVSAEHGSLHGLPDTDSMRKYNSLTAAIREGRTDEAKKLGSAAGWQLDALKFLPALQLVYARYPNKKWYLILDDDTYIIRPSLRLLLGHLDPSKPLYIGNVIGDYKTRFAHGGSSFLVSQAAMGRLLSERNRASLDLAYRESLTETLGDKLVARAFMKVNVFVEERYSHFFNGERPLITRMRADRFCSPLISFHGLAEPQQMLDVGRRFAGYDRHIVWGDLWKIYEQPSLDALDAAPIRHRRDHVGRVDESAGAAATASSASQCLDYCGRKGRDCLAWTWDKEKQACRTSPWVIIGNEALPPTDSGLNIAVLRSLVGDCGGLITW